MQQDNATMSPNMYGHEPSSSAVKLNFNEATEATFKHRYSLTFLNSKLLIVCKCLFRKLHTFALQLLTDPVHYESWPAASAPPVLKEI